MEPPVSCGDPLSFALSHDLNEDNGMLGDNVTEFGYVVVPKASPISFVSTARRSSDAVHCKVCRDNSVCEQAVTLGIATPRLGRAHDVQWV